MNEVRAMDGISVDQQLKFVEFYSNPYLGFERPQSVRSYDVLSPTFGRMLHDYEQRTVKAN